MNFVDLILIAVLAAVVVFAVVFRFRRKKQGKGCCGECEGCSGGESGCNLQNRRSSGSR